MKPIELARWVARLAVAGVFVLAAVPKLLDPASFAEAIDNYRMMPPTWTGPLATVLPPIELVAALAIVLGPHRRGAALVAAGMLAVFALGIGQALLRDINIDCGCFGNAAQSEASWLSVVRNATLMALALLVATAPRRASMPASEPSEAESGTTEA